MNLKALASKFLINYKNRPILVNGLVEFAKEVSDAICNELASKATMVTHPVYMKYVTTSDIEELKNSIRNTKTEPYFSIPGYYNASACECLACRIQRGDL